MSLENRLSQEQLLNWEVLDRMGSLIVSLILIMQLPDDPDESYYKLAYLEVERGSQFKIKKDRKVVFDDAKPIPMEIASDLYGLQTGFEVWGEEVRFMGILISSYVCGIVLVKDLYAHLQKIYTSPPDLDSQLIIARSRFDSSPEDIDFRFDPEAIIVDIPEMMSANEILVPANKIYHVEAGKRVILMQNSEGGVIVKKNGMLGLPMDLSYIIPLHQINLLHGITPRANFKQDTRVQIANLIIFFEKGSYVWFK